MKKIKEVYSYFKQKVMDPCGNIMQNTITKRQNSLFKSYFYLKVCFARKKTHQKANKKMPESFDNFFYRLKKFLDQLWNFLVL